MSRLWDYQAADLSDAGKDPGCHGKQSCTVFSAPGHCTAFAGRAGYLYQDRKGRRKKGAGDHAVYYDRYSVPVCSSKKYIQDLLNSPQTEGNGQNKRHGRKERYRIEDTARKKECYRIEDAAGKKEIYRMENTDRREEM